MEHSTQKIIDPIHLPCPDMAGCINPDPQKTANSIKMARKCLQRIRQLRKEDQEKKRAARLAAKFGA